MTINYINPYIKKSISEMAIQPILAHQEEEYRIIRVEHIFIIEFKSNTSYCTTFLGDYWRGTSEFNSLEDAINCANEHIENCRIDKERRAKGYPYITLEAIQLKEDGKINEYVKWLEKKLVDMSTSYDRLKYDDD